MGTCDLNLRRDGAQEKQVATHIQLEGEKTAKNAKPSDGLRIGRRHTCLHR
jgi:hypothetical protein